LTPILRQRQASANRKRSKGLHEHLSALDDAVTQQWLAIGMAYPLAENILQHGQTPPAELRQKLHQLVHEFKQPTDNTTAACDASTHLTANIRKIRRGNKGRGETRQTTYQLLQSGLSIRAIAEQRSLTPATIENHIARGIGEGIVEIESVLSVDDIAVLTDYLSDKLNHSLKDAVAHFGNAYTYGQIRMVAAWLQRQQASAESTPA
jgi:uncharacterized protein YpbB